MTAIWTVVMITEDGDVKTWVRSFASQEAALKAVQEDHYEMWIGSEEDGKLVVLPTSASHSAVCLANDEISWPVWTITKTELEQ